MDSPMPKYRFKKVTDITAEDLHKMGVKAVGLDVDNTICFDGTMNFTDGIFDWVGEILRGGFKITIITNDVNPRAGRIARALGLPYVSFAMKPITYKVKLAAKRMGVKTTEMAMVGDQLFSDMKAANRCGAVAVRVDPMDGDSGTHYKRYYAARRRREQPFIEEFEKNHGYGVYDE